MELEEGGWSFILTGYIYNTEQEAGVGGQEPGVLSLRVAVLLLS